MKNKKLDKIIENLVELSFKKGVIDNTFVKKAVLSLKKLKSSQAIYCLEKYQKGLKRKIDQSTLTIESYSKLSTIEISQIKKDLNTKYLILNTEFILNPSLLGGIKIKIGDYLFDYSLKNNIKQLGEAIRG